MTDQEILVQHVRTRVKAQVDAHVDTRVRQARELLHSAGVLFFPTEGGTTPERTLIETVGHYKRLKVEELLPLALDEVLAKVTFNILTEGHDGQAEKEPA